MNKSITIGAIVAVLLIIVGYVVLQTDTISFLVTHEVATTTPVVVTPPVTEPVATSTATPPATPPIDTTKTVIGTSVKGNPITAYHFGTGADEILFIGGIHGGYEWNTSLVAYELIDYLTSNAGVIPANVKVTVIPVMNPDGLSAVVGTTSRFLASAVPKAEKDTVVGRFNGNTVDLNRNFDCEWQASGMWQNQKVSGGSAAFSEPEAVAVRDYVNAHKIAGAVVWYSAAGGVFASNCKNGVLAETKTLTTLYAKAAGYPAKEEFNFYDITGDMVNWFAKENIPAISVLLTNHTDTEWSKNKAGIDALLNHYKQ
jgi:murein tripeptide amidase MpaA